MLAVLSYQVAPDLASGTLVRLLMPFERPPVPVQLVYPSARLLAPRVRAFLDFGGATAVGSGRASRRLTRSLGLGREIMRLVFAAGTLDRPVRRSIAQQLG